MDAEERTVSEEESPSPSGWQGLKDSLDCLLSAAGSLASIRWEMARTEGGQWAASLLRRGIALAAAALLAVFSMGLLSAGLVAALQLWLGSWVAAIFVAFGLEAGAAALLVWAPWRKPAPPPLETTLRELRKDAEALRDRA